MNSPAPTPFFNFLLPSTYMRGEEKAYNFQSWSSIPHQSKKTRNYKFCINIPLGNTSLDLKYLLDKSAQFYKETKAAKEMADQVLVRDLNFGDMDGNNDPPHLNV